MTDDVASSRYALPEDRQALRAAIVDGAAESLAGLRECDWFDAKGAPYRLDQTDEKYELAKDVTAFANADGGILLLPVTTDFDANGELVKRVKDVELGLLDADRVLKVIKEWVEPRVQGLEVQVIETVEGRGRLMIHVPPQPRETWPHIVTRGSFDDLLHNVGVSICVRAGADIATHSAPAVHALLAEGHRSRTRGSTGTGRDAVVADPPSFEPAPAGTGSFNQHQASGALNAHLTNHGGSAALVLGVELGSPFGAHTGQVWLAEEREGSPSDPPLRVPRGAHLQIRFEDPALRTLGQAGGELELRITYQPVSDPSITRQLNIQLLRRGTNGGRPQWKAGRQRLVRIAAEPSAPTGADDLLDELATIKRRLQHVRTSGWYGYDFFLPADEYHEHKDAIPRHLREALRAVYVPADDLNRIVKRRDPDGSDVQPSDDLEGLFAAVGEAQRQLEQL